MTEQSVTERSVTHTTFVVERTYDAPPARVFAAWADPAIKRRWFGSSESGGDESYELDFRVGGRERSRGGAPEGGTYAYEALYYDIVPDQRIVSAYEMYLDGTRISVSLGTIELHPAGAGTRLVYTEQGAFLDGLDEPAQRRNGTASLLDALGAELARSR